MILDIRWCLFFLMDHLLYWFSTFSEKVKKIYQLKIWIFCKMHRRILFFLALCLSAWRFWLPVEGLSFVKTLATFGIINATDSLTQNINSKNSLSLLIHLWYFTLKTLETMLIYVCHFFKIRLVFHTLYLWNEVHDPHVFFSLLKQVIHYLSTAEVWRKSIE